MSTIPPVGSVPDVVTNTVIASDWGNAVGAASRGRVVQRFNTTTERDSSITAPVTGMLCYVSATDTFYGYRSGSRWVAVAGAAIANARARMYRQAALTTAAAAFTVVPYDSIDIDPGGSLTIGAAAAYTCPVAGRYLVTGRFSFAGLARIITTVYRNGGEAARGLDIQANAGPTSSSQVTSVLSAAAGDKFQLLYFTGLAAVAELGTGICFMSVDLVALT